MSYQHTDKMKKYIVTGGAGFIGSHIVDALIDRGDSVIIIDNLSGGTEEINPKAEMYPVDIRHLDNIDAAFKDVEGIFHLAAMARVQPSIEDPELFHDVNVNGTFALLKKCVDHKIPNFVFSSSSSVYGEPETMPMVETMLPNPLSPYACNKLIGENYCQTFASVYGVNTVSLRYFNVYGDRMPLDGQYRLVSGIFAKQLLNDEPLTITNDGNQRRDFTYVQDVVQANLLAEEYAEKYKGEVFNVGNGDNRSVLEMAALFQSPHELKFVGSVLEPKETLADNSKIHNELGWTTSMAVEDFYPGWISDLKSTQA